jgi:CHAT domain-containing protein
VVADPNDNLTATVDEATRVVSAIQAVPGWEARSLLHDDATSVRVRDALSTVSWFHYAGHGAFDPRSGLDSALLLANGTRLTVSDVLALPHSPSNVVLSGCDTGRAGEGGAAEALGLAQAFVAIGARVVVASVRPIRDDVAGRLSSLLYRNFSAGDFELARALRDAQRTMREMAPGSDWSAFRAVTP